LRRDGQENDPMSVQSWCGPTLAVSGAWLLVAVAAASGCSGASPEQVQAAYDESVEALRAQDYRAAAEAAARAVELDPKRIDAWMNLGIANSRQENWTEAIEAYEHAIDLDPRQKKTLNNLANVYFRQGRYEDAAVWYGKALEIDPDYLLASFHYGWTLRQLNRLDEAERVFEHCIEIPASNDRERMTHLDCYFYTGSIKFRKGEYRSAARIMEEVLSIRPGHSEARYLLGVCYRKMGRLDDAAEQLEIHRQMLQAMRATPIPEPVDE
jgi:tetratricopeptide (TPR) repeat protein